MAKAKVNKVIVYLYPKQEKFLKDESEKNSVSVSGAVRSIINREIEKKNAKR